MTEQDTNPTEQEKVYSLYDVLLEEDLQVRPDDVIRFSKEWTTDDIVNAVDRARYRINGMRAREQYSVKAYSEEQKRSAMWERVLYRERNQHREAMRSLYGDAAQIDLETSQVWETWLKFIIHVGVLVSQESEAHQLMIELDDEGHRPGARELWSEYSSTLRKEDGTYRRVQTPTEAMADAYLHLGSRLSLNIADPRLADGWQVIHRTAKTNGFCGVWDDLAEVVGLELPSLSRSGQVTVTGSFEVTIYVEDVEGDIADYLDADTVAREISEYDVSIDNIDDSELVIE